MAAAAYPTALWGDFGDTLIGNNDFWRNASSQNLTILGMLSLCAAICLESWQSGWTSFSRALTASLSIERCISIVQGQQLRAFQETVKRHNRE
jgi:hypothetical protein